jgi:hypothetical protein
MFMAAHNDRCILFHRCLLLFLPKPSFQIHTSRGPFQSGQETGLTDVLDLVSCPRNSMSFAAGQLAVFQDASDEHI